IAGQSVPAGKRGDAAVFDSAESALGRCPESAVPVESKAANSTRAQPVGGGVRCADLTVAEIGDAASQKPEPQAALTGISNQTKRIVRAIHAGPWNSFDLTP